MASDKRILKVFISSPSDVQPERNVVKEVIEELNSIDGFPVNFRAVMWEDFYPEMGQNPQDIINARIKDNYDILICIIWGRIGTPTQNAESGTIEEFEKAMQRHALNQSPFIMLYFKDEAISPSMLDIDQMQRVLKFKESTIVRGIFKPFITTEDFKSKIRLNLMAKYLTASIEQTTPINTLMKEYDETVVEVYEELGLLDYKEAQVVSFNNVVEITKRLNEGINNVNLALKTRTSELDNLPKNIKGQVDDNLMRDVCAKLAKDLQVYSSSIMTEITPFRSSFNTGIDSLLQTAQLLIKNNSIEVVLPEIKKSTLDLIELQQGLNSGKEGISSFRDKMSVWSSITKELNGAKREMVKSLDSLIDEMSRADMLLHSAISTLLQLNPELQRV